MIRTSRRPKFARAAGGLMNFRVLIWSLLGIVLAFGLIYLIFFSWRPPADPTTGV